MPDPQTTNLGLTKLDRTTPTTTPLNLQTHLDDNWDKIDAAFVFDSKNSVRVATTANITLSGTQTIDGVAVVAGDRVLVKNQTTANQNGIYVVAAGIWTRAADSDTSAKVTSGMEVRVSEGTTQTGSSWFLSTLDPIVLGTTNLTFSGVIKPWGDNTLTNRSLSVVSNNASQAISANVATKLLWQSILTDYQAEFSTANNRFTAKNAGMYDIGGTINLSGVTAGTTSISINVYKNGVAFHPIAIFVGSGPGPSVPFTDKLILAAGDFIEIYITTSTSTSVGSGSYWNTVREA